MHSLHLQHLHWLKRVGWVRRELLLWFKVPGKKNCFQEENITLSIMSVITLMELPPTLPYCIFSSSKEQALGKSSGLGLSFDSALHFPCCLTQARGV